MTIARGKKRVRRVAVVTGTRAEYGLLVPVMRAIDAHRSLNLHTVVTGMHLLRKFGSTVREIVRDGWSIDARVPMQRGDDSPLDQARGLSRGITGVSTFLHDNGTDIVVVLGDRIEAMAGALAAVTTGCLLAHIHGGDLAPGDIDDSLRHAITKLAHLHLAATPSAARRIVRMGESTERVHCVGAPGLDGLRQLVEATPERRGGGVLVLHHACGRSADVEKRVMTTILRAAAATGLTQTIIYPNSDRGHRGIIDAIEAHGRRSPVRVVRSLAREAYLRELIAADVLLGNSSSGIIEAATAGTPVVNIGRRQEGRERSGPSVIDATESATVIRAALQRALRKRPITGLKTTYGEGNAGPQIAQYLAAVPLEERFRRKMNAF